MEMWNVLMEHCCKGWGVETFFCKGAEVGLLGESINKIHDTIIAL
jgi:hypothetical protein